MTRILFLGSIILSLVVAALWAGKYDYGPVVITKESEFKLVLRFGSEPRQVLDKPGVAFRLPLLDSVQIFDRRLQYLNAEPVEMLIAKGEKLVVDYFVIWEISDPLSFRESFPGLMPTAQGRILEIVRSTVGAQIGELDLVQLLERVDALDGLAAQANAELTGDGVRIVDVRLNRAEIPPSALPAAYEQMREQRRALSRKFRAQGDRAAREIRAEAEREARTEVAQARGDAEAIRGEGDAIAIQTYAEAHGQDPEFYAFVRSLQAYRESLSSGTTVVLPPDHGFLRFFDPDAREGLPAVSAPPQ